MRKHLLCLISLLITSTTFIYSVPLKVEYYGVVSVSSDSNMTKMAQDIFFTQLKSIDYISVEDKRPDISKASKSIPNFIQNNETHLVFYAEIEELFDSDNNQRIWNCKFNAMNPEDEIIHTKTEVYDSYYKILSGARFAIENVISDFQPKDKSSKSENSTKSQVKTFNGNIDIESLAGTWYGEPYTDKIMILRGGRGFIIFKNGATMNIKITVKKTDSKGNVSEIEISQIGKSNASFFPELPRQTALNVASAAPTIVWNFTIDSGILSGTKKTLITTDNEIGAKEGLLETTWSKNK